MPFPELPERVRRYTEGMPPGDWRDAVADFGFVGDGATDNAAAWMRFNEWCRSETLAGRTSMVFFPPTPAGKYVYDVSKGMGSLLGIRDLIFYAAGAVFQNTYGGPDRFLRDAHWTNHTGVSFWTDMGFGDPIDTMHPGSVAFTLKDPLRATGRLRVGDHVLVGSRDDQFYGYPPNIGQHEIRRIASRHMTGGTLDAPVAFHHRDDFPDGSFKIRGGRARLWQLDDELGRHGTAMTGWSRIWDINHVMYGGTVLPGANARDPDHYVNIIGKRVVYVDFTRPGISQMTNGELVLDGCRLTTRSEPDKNCGRTIMRGGSSEKMVHQSESIGDIDAEDWSFTKLVPGAARGRRGRRLVVAPTPRVWPHATRHEPLHPHRGQHARHRRPAPERWLRRRHGEARRGRLL